MHMWLHCGSGGFGRVVVVFVAFVHYRLLFVACDIVWILFFVGQRLTNMHDQDVPQLKKILWKNVVNHVSY